MFISPYVYPELGHWYIMWKIKGHSCCKTITSSESHVKNVFIS